MTATTKEARNTAGTDRIEKTLVLRAPRSRVWRAITSAKEFGTWFRMSLDGEFTAGAKVPARVAIPGYEHMKVEFHVANIDPERYFAYRWHPYPNDATVDYSTEPMTLVEFTLEDSGNDTALTIVESGFDKLPATRRAEAFRMNDGGWTGQMKNLAQYVA